MDVNETYCNDHFTIYTGIESRCAPETDSVSYISIFKKTDMALHSKKFICNTGRYLNKWRNTHEGKKGVKHRWWDAKNLGWCFCDFFLRLDVLERFLSGRFHLRCEWQEWGSLAKIREKSIPGRESQCPGSDAGTQWSRETQGKARKRAGAPQVDFIRARSLGFTEVWWGDPER